MKRKFSDDELKIAVATSTSIRQVLNKIGLVEAGSNYENIKHQIAVLNLDISHIHGRAWNKGLKFQPKHAKTLEEIFAAQERVNSHKLRKRLIKANIFKAQCSNCNHVEWMGVPIPLELEHIDGDRSNNSLQNLKLLCPNCHALTPTFRRRKSSLGSALPVVPKDN